MSLIRFKIPFLSGKVGQEVYGAGVAFGIVPCHFYNVPNESSMIFVDYRTGNFIYHHENVVFKIKGDARLTARMLIVNTNTSGMLAFNVKGNGRQLTGTILENGNIEFCVYGNQQIEINWAS